MGTHFAYENTNLLTWFDGEIKIELFSSLSKAEMLKFTEKIEPMSATEGAAPPPLCGYGASHYERPAP